jgi:isocitrate/isopropylmalate dehydrogenase
VARRPARRREARHRREDHREGLADTIAAGTAIRDLGGSASTTEFTAAVIKAIGAGR